MKNTNFLIVGQNFDYNFKIENGKTTIVDVFNFILSNDLTQDKWIEIYQSETGQYSPGWGRIVYKISDEGILYSYAFNVDSSG